MNILDSYIDYSIVPERTLEPCRPRYERSNGPGWVNVSAQDRNTGVRRQYDKDRRKIVVIHPIRRILCAPSFSGELIVALRKSLGPPVVDKCP